MKKKKAKELDLWEPGMWEDMWMSGLIRAQPTCDEGVRIYCGMTAFLGLKGEMRRHGRMKSGLKWFRPRLPGFEGHLPPIYLDERLPVGAMLHIKRKLGVGWSESETQ